MKSPSSLRYAILLVVVALMATASSVRARTASRPPVEDAAAAPVRGLIVQLRDAPSHVAVAQDRERARALSHAAGASLATREDARWQRLVAALQQDVALTREIPALQQPPRRDPVGASAQVLRFDRPLAPAQAERVAARLAALPEVASVSANLRERRQAVALNPPSDPYFPGPAGQWWLHPVQGSNGQPINARLRGVAGFLSAWAFHTIGEASAVVAVLDTGITPHPELAGHVLPGYDFVADWDPVAQLGYANDGDGRDSDPSDPGDWVSQADRNADATRYANCEIEDSSWHGTVIAGMLAAQTDNGDGVAGINWNGRVLPVRVAGKCGAELADIIDGMRWAAGLPVCKRSDGVGGCAEFAPINPHPARIVNISFGGSAVCGAAYQAAIDELRSAPGGGAVVVAAAGNGWGAPSRPASCQRVIGVAALNRDGFKTNYSSFGAALAIATVGGDDGDGAWGPLLADSGVLTIGNTGSTVPATADYYFHYGTSFSAPVVAGAAGLMLSVNPALTADQLMQGLAISARPHVRSSLPGFGVCSNANPGRCLCTTSTCGAGILDIAQALLYAQSPSGYRAPAVAAADIDTVELRAALALGADRPPNTPPPPPPPAPASGGGGAMSAGWLLALGVAAWALRAALSERSPLLPGRARKRRPAPRR